MPFKTFFWAHPMAYIIREREELRRREYEKREAVEARRVEKLRAREELKNMHLEVGKKRMGPG